MNNDDTIAQQTSTSQLDKIHQADPVTLMNYFNTILKFNVEEQKAIINHPSFPVHEIQRQLKNIDSPHLLKVAELAENPAVIDTMISFVDYEPMERAIWSNQNLSQEQYYRYFKFCYYYSQSILNRDELLKHKNASNVCKEESLMNSNIGSEEVRSNKTISIWMLDYVDNPLNVLLKSEKSLIQNTTDLRNNKTANKSPFIKEAREEKYFNNLIKVFKAITLLRIKTKNYTNNAERISNKNSTISESIIIGESERKIIDIALKYGDRFNLTLSPMLFLVELLDTYDKTYLLTEHQLNVNNDMVVKEIIELNDSLLNSYLLMFPKLSTNILDHYAVSDNAFDRLLVASHENTSSETLNMLLNDENESIVYEAMVNKNFHNVELVEKLVNSDDVVDRRLVTRLCNLSFDDMMFLSSDSDVEVRAGLFFNKNLPSSLRNLL